MRDDRGCPPLERVERLFHRAAALPHAERGRFLRDACGHDDALRREILALLEADDGDLSLVDRLHRDAEERPPDRRWTGLRLGPYRLEEPIGEGGMSKVFRARRDDARYERAVAVKVLTLDRPVVRARFHAECRILAALEHPSIARLYDAGALDDGTPYVVMELVDGEPIDRYADRCRLGVTARLRLLLEVCAAVEHAHRRLVVHRDLKPSNILVTANGHAKLLDFGIAKLLDAAGAGGGGLVTALELQPMTPQYASPEQVRGEPVSTASDVFSLGVLLYELLCGSLPYRFEAVSLADRRGFTDRLRRVPPPSVALADQRDAGLAAARRSATPERLRRRLEGDLDAVVMKALRPEAAHRYASAEELARDLRRHLEHRPVDARTGTWRYRAATFVRRRRLGLAVAVGFLAVLGALVTSLVTRADAVERERDRASQVDRFILDLFEVYNPDAEVRGETVRELLDRGVHGVRGRTSLSDDLRATLLDRLGTLYGKIGAPDAAAALFEEAVELRRRLYGSAHVDTIRSRLHHAAAIHGQGHYRESAERLRELLDLARGSLGDDHLLTADILSALALAADGVDGTEESIELLREAVAIRRRHTAEAGDLDLAGDLDQLGYFLGWSGEWEEGKSKIEEALALRRQHLGETHPAVAESLLTLATFHHDAGHYRQAVDLARKALAIRRTFRDPDHPEVTSTLNVLARAVEAAGDLEGAEALLREAIERSTRRKGERHPDVVTLVNNLASVLRKRGALVEAEAAYRRVLELRLELLGPDHAFIGQTSFSLGLVLHERGELAAAEASFRQARANADARLPPGSSLRSLSRVELGRVLIDLGRAEEAEPVLRSAHRIAAGALDADHWRVANAAVVLGVCLATLGRHEASRPLLAANLPVLVRARGEESWEVRWSRQRLAARVGPGEATAP